MNTENDEVLTRLLKHINDSPALLSALYDLDLLPEQLESDSRDWRRMIYIAQSHRLGELRFDERP